MAPSIDLIFPTDAREASSPSLDHEGHDPNMRNHDFLEQMSVRGEVMPADQTAHDSNENQTTTRFDFQVPVLIIGAGPTGLLMAYMLSKLGVRSLVVEKYPTRLAAPKAHAINPRSLEICRQFGLNTAAMRKIGTARADACWVNFVTNLSGQRIGRLPYERMDPNVLNDTPEMIHNIPQPDLEQFIADHLMHDSNVEIRKSIGFASCLQSSHGVSTTLEERGTGIYYTVQSQYVVACDGAKSTVREFLGVKCVGEDSYEAMMTIHFTADLRPILGENGVGMLHWIMDPAVSGFIIGYDLSGNQVLICNFDSQRHPAAIWTEAHARSVVTAALGRNDIAFDIRSFRPWVLSRKVAERYSVGNVFLCGDAAHAFPPTGGLGLNCGLADVQNLAYKLAAVLQGCAEPSLLTTYEGERRHLAELYSQQSVKNGKKIFGFLKTLGLADANPDDVEGARANLVTRVSEPRWQQRIEHEVEGQREHFDNLELHIGYVYGNGAYQPPHASKFTAKFVPGARLPHAWITPRSRVTLDRTRSIDVSYVPEFSTMDINARRFSTLDLVPFDGFVLVAGKLDNWLEKAKYVKQDLESKGIRFMYSIAGKDFDFTMPESDAGWTKQSGIDVGDALLVRPDQHILARIKPHSGVDTIIGMVLGHLGR